jgi:hypothetical protein
MDCPNSDDRLSCSPPSANRTFCLGWFRISHPGDPSANLCRKVPLHPSEKEYGMDRQEGQTSTRVTRGNEDHQIFRLGDTIPGEDIRLQKAGNGVRFTSPCFSVGIDRVSMFLGTSVRCCSFALRTTLWL